MVNANIVTGKYVDKKGRVQIYLQVSIQRKVKRYKLFKALPDEFDNNRQIMKKGHNRENLIINQALSKVEEINLSNQNITLTMFESLYLGVSQNPNITDFAHSTISMMAVRTLLKLFPDATFLNIGENEAEAWLKYMLRNYKKSSVTIYMSCLRGIFDRATKKKAAKSNPFACLKTPKVETHREYLTMEDLDGIEKISLNGRQQPYRDMFLLECYTGLRMSDIKSLEWSDISEGAIHKTMIKTKEEVFIPLNSKAKSIIERQPKEDRLIFQNSATSIPNINNHIREICRMAGITKKITSHCGRHTFAIQSLNKRIPIEVVSKLLGHKDLKTTQIYAKVANPLIVDYMKRWDE